MFEVRLSFLIFRDIVGFKRFSGQEEIYRRNTNENRYYSNHKESLRARAKNIAKANKTGQKIAAYGELWGTR